MSKARLNLSLDQDLIDFAKVFATENRTTVADIVTQYLLSLKRRVNRERTEQILAHPRFRQAMEETISRLQDGSAEWSSFSEVFSE